MTYREKIHELKKRIASIYEDAEWLRDEATLEEKKHWNDLRRIFYDADAPLIKLDDSLTRERANMKI